MSLLIDPQAQSCSSWWRAACWNASTQSRASAALVEDLFLAAWLMPSQRRLPSGCSQWLSGLVRREGCSSFAPGELVLFLQPLVCDAVVSLLPCVYMHITSVGIESELQPSAAPKALPGAASRRYHFLLCVAGPRQETKSPRSQRSVRPDSYRHFTPRFKASVLPKVRVVLGLVTWAGGEQAFWGWGRWVCPNRFHCALCLKAICEAHPDGR